MKILFIGSNPDDRGTLAFEREITVLQRRALASSHLDVSFHFLPKCTLEELPQDLLMHRPDIVHFSAHGEKGHLELASESGAVRKVTAEMIQSFLDPEHPPKLVYLSACDSDEIAKKLSLLGQCAIGTTAPITNGAARATALCFYDRIFRGFSIKRAHKSAEQILNGVNPKLVKLFLRLPKNKIISDEILVRVPKLVAEPEGKPDWDKDGWYSLQVRVGVINYPMDTVRISFMSPDPSFEEEAIDAEYPGYTSGNTCWSEGWYVFGDFLIVAAGATITKLTFTESALVTEALNNCLHVNPTHRKSTDAEIKEAIRLLKGEVRRPLVQKTTKKAAKNIPKPKASAIRHTKK